MYDYDEPLPEPSPPLSSDLQALPRIWSSVLLHPRVSTYDTQVADASWQRIGIGLALLVVANGVSDYLAALETGHATLSNIGSSALYDIVGFVLFTGIWYWFAKRLGGRGQFMPYAYLLSLVFVPFGLLIDIIQLVPAIGGIQVAGPVTLALNMYTIASLLLAAAAVHQFSKRKAALVLFAPIGFFVLVAGVFALLALGALELLNLLS